MKCYFCNNELQEASEDGKYYSSLICKTHLPKTQVRMLRDWNNFTQQWNGPIIKVIIECPWPEVVEYGWWLATVDILFDLVTNRFRISINTPMGEYEEQEEVVQLNRLPTNITPENAHEMVKRYMNLRAFS